MPQQLSEQPNFVWKVPLAHAGLGGIAATDKHVLFGDRDADDFQDVYRCLDANSGELIWEVERLAIAALDYGNSPRATPIISGERVYFHGAHGHLLCVQLADGQVVWEKNFRDDFPLDDDLPWGYCGSPLLIDSTLIVAAGAKDASVIALNAATGKLKWKSPGIAPGYGSLNVGTLGGVKQIVGHDAKTIGGWDPETGKRLWTITPISDGDFNVPTPIIWDGKLILVTEIMVAEYSNSTPMAIRTKTQLPYMKSCGRTCARLSLLAQTYFASKTFCIAWTWRTTSRSAGDCATSAWEPTHR